MRTTDHQEIKRWVESHNGEPELIDDEDAEGDEIGLRINFPGEDDEMYLREKDAQSTSWTTFFTIFDDQELVFEYNDGAFKDDPSSSYRFHPRSQVNENR